MKLFKSTLGFMALVAVIMFSACGGSESTTDPTPPTRLEIIAGLEGQGGKTWEATSVSENGTSINNGNGFQITLTYAGALQANYTISQGTLDDAYWPNWNNTMTSGQVVLEGLDSDDLTFDNVSPCKFGGQAPTDTEIRLEWVNTNDKSTPRYIMILQPVVQ